MSEYKGLFINNKKAKDSIYESGSMIFNCLQSDIFKLDYIEIDINDRTIPSTYDFYFFNYHPVTMGWLDTKSLKKKLGFVITIVLEILPDDPFVMCSSRDFDAYCVIDPSLHTKQRNVYPFPRPLEKINFPLPEINNPIPVIGTFGFATKGKGFQHVVEAVNKEFERAKVLINIPYGDFVPESKAYAIFLGNVCKQKANPGIDVLVTHDFMEKNDLIKWCASNTLNCFLYDRDLPGLAATTDQAIASGKPLSVSNNNTFRHITSYLPFYPKWSLNDSIHKSIPLVEQMKTDWSPHNFSKKFEYLLKDNQIQIKNKKPEAESKFELPLKAPTIGDAIERRLKKYKRQLKKFNLSAILKSNDSEHSKEII